MTEVIEAQTLYITYLGQKIQINQGIPVKNMYSSGTFFNYSLNDVYVRLTLIGFSDTKQLLYIPSGTSLEFENLPIQFIEVPTNISGQPIQPNLIIDITSFITEESVTPKIKIHNLQVINGTPNQFTNTMGTFTNAIYPLTVPNGYKAKIYNIGIEFTNTSTATTTFQAWVSMQPNESSLSLVHNYQNAFLYNGNFTLAPNATGDVFIGKYLQTNIPNTVLIPSTAIQQINDIEIFAGDNLSFSVYPSTVVAYYIEYTLIPLINWID